MAQTEQERLFNATLRRAAKRGSVTVVEQQGRGAKAGKFMGGDMNAWLRSRAGRVSLIKAEQAQEYTQNAQVMHGQV